MRNPEDLDRWLMSLSGFQLWSLGILLVLAILVIVAGIDLLFPLDPEAIKAIKP